LAGRVDPSSNGDGPPPGVEPDGDPARMQGRELAHELGPLDRTSTDYDPGRACRQQIATGLDAANAPAGLNAARHRGADRLDDAEVDALAGPGGVEIDDVDPGGAGCRERLRHEDGIVAVHGLSREVPPLEPDHLPGTQVDRGVQLEGHPSTASPSSTAGRRLRS